MGAVLVFLGLLAVDLCVIASRWVRRHWPAFRHAVAVGAVWTARTVRRVAVATARWSFANWPVARRGVGRAVAAAGGALAMAVVGVVTTVAVVLAAAVAAAGAGFRGTRSGLRRMQRAAGRWHDGVAAGARTPSATTRWSPAPGSQLAPAALARRLSVVALIAVALSSSAVSQSPGTLAGNALAAAVDVDPGPVRLPALRQRSIVYAADGSVLAVLHGDQNRQPVKLDQVAPVLVKAVIDIEDDRFWEHDGVDTRSVLRAVTTNLRSGKARQGGSTITQQLVKNSLLTPERSITRKIKEVLLARRVEDQFSKRQILERYLNTVYFGEGAYGIEAAAETYFGVPATKLDTAQAALLAGLIRNPEGYDPVRNVDAARARRRLVLDAMVRRHHLAPAAAAEAARAPVPETAAKPPDVNDHFTDAVVRGLLGDDRLGATASERYRKVFGGGLAVHTTLDPRLQRQAQDALARGLPHAAMPLTGAVVAVDPATGAVRALVGGREFHRGGFNAAIEGRRQPGSAFKTFTLVTALEQGMSPDEVLDGSTPCSVPNPGGTPNPWRPGNFEGEAFGRLSLTDATAHSVNCAYARLALRVGLHPIEDTAHRMGIASRLQAVPSMTLGTNVVTPLEMASAYATLAADGVHHAPHLVDAVEDARGHTVISAPAPPARAMSAEVARETTAVLQQVVQRGTGRAAALGTRPVAGKTGTAQDYADAWFVGYTPQLATAVWMGDATGEHPMHGIGGIDVTGGSYPARMWSAFMSAALAGQPEAGFPAPARVPSATGVAPSTSPTGQPGKSWCWSSCGHKGPPPKHHP